MNCDAAFAAGYAHLLFAVGTLEIAVLPIFCPGIEVFCFPLQRADQLQIAGILRAALINAAGQAAEDGYDHKYQGNPVEDVPAGDNGDQVKHKVGNHETQIQLVIAIAAGHEFAKKSPYQRLHLLSKSDWYYHNPRKCPRQWVKRKQNVNFSLHDR